LPCRIIDANLVSARLNRDTEAVAEIVEAFLDETYQALRRGDCVFVRGFGSFYVRPERDSWVFKFNPSQRLRKVLGWWSSYRDRYKATVG
jgi:DNA-binding protein HU-beta